MSPEQEGFRAKRSCERAITHLGLCVEDTHSHKKDIVLCYLDFKEAFPSIDHKQVVRVLEFLGLPSDFTRLVSNLYSGATTEFITQYGHISPLGIHRGTLQGDPFSPLIFDLMVEPLIKWLTASGKGYDIASCGLKLASNLLGLKSLPIHTLRERHSESSAYTRSATPRNGRKDTFLALDSVSSNEQRSSSRQQTTGRDSQNAWVSTAFGASTPRTETPVRANHSLL
jgi:hypothetical protein